MEIVTSARQADSRNYDKEKQKRYSIAQRVTGHTADLLAALHGDTPLKDFGLTSIAFIQFVVALEDEFGIEVLDSDLDFGKFSTVNALFGTLEKYFSKNTLKKVLVCDCDNVLWRGISGEEPTVIDAAADAVQNELLRLYNAGVLLCICSRNQPGNISAAFRQPGMTLKREHILISKVSGNDKPSALREIAAELNLSPDSFVFVDDSD
ncbi:MAG: HAD-IIIC family phosphatase [Lachnospiraceae bacterium]